MTTQIARKEMMRNLEKHVLVARELAPVRVINVIVNYTERY